MPNPWDGKSESITQAEHISPDKSGDNIAAKKVANFKWNPVTLEWERDTGGNSLPTAGNNPAITLTYSGNYVSTIKTTINSVDYTRTLSYDVTGKLTGVSEAV